MGEWPDWKRWPKWPNRITILRQVGQAFSSLTIGDSSDVIFCGQNELVVEDPLRFVVEACRRVKLDNLVVFDGQVVTRPLKMGNLQFKKFKL